jgi:hypothetical protein
MADVGERPMTLPTDSVERKNYPMLRGCVNYFPAALAGVAKISKLGNDKHNPGQPLHHARDKSTDHADCIIRHLIDTEDLLSANAPAEQILIEVSQMAWRVLAYSQTLHEKFGAPLAPGARVGKQKETKSVDLFYAAQQAHKEIDEMMVKRKFPTTYSIENNVKFSKGDTVKHINNDVEVTVEGTYFDEQGKAVLFVKDADNKIFGVDPTFYKGIYK